MAASAGGWVTPYDRTPGGSTPSPHVSPEHGTHELKIFFWLAVASSTIILAVGFSVWLGLLGHSFP